MAPARLAYGTKKMFLLGGGDGGGRQPKATACAFPDSKASSDKSSPQPRLVP